jgi:5-methylcytosine-specific restriction endonuclease McrA
MLPTRNLPRWIEFLIGLRSTQEGTMERVSKLDKLSKEQWDDLIKRLGAVQNGLCYVCEKVINLQVHEVDIDHIIALTHGGPDDETNWGLTHSSCNRSKGARDLQLQRILFRFKRDVEKHTAINDSNRGGNFTLNEALKELVPNRQDFGVQLKGKKVILSWNERGQPYSEEFQLMEERGTPSVCSFVGRLPFTCLHHDHETNPRSIVDLEPMIEEFYSGYPQLQPSLATLALSGTDGKAPVLVFDGQHKAAAQLYAGKDRLMVRVFLNYDRKKLKETNYRAHTKLAQVHFPQLVNDRVGTDLFREEFDRFVRESNTMNFSERSFFKQLPHQQRSEFRQYFQNYLRYEVLTGKAGNDDSQILSFTETVTARSNRFPLSYDAVQKTFLQNFLVLKPTPEPIAESEKYRRLERENLIRLMNLFVVEILASGRFDLNVGTHRMEERLQNNPETVPDSHLRAYRICRRAAMTIWTKELMNAIVLLLGTRTRYPAGRSWGQQRPLWAEILKEDWDQIRKMVQVIRDHKIWAERKSAEIVSAIAATRQKDWEQILLKGRLPGRQDQLIPPLDQNFIFTASLQAST